MSGVCFRRRKINIFNFFLNVAFSITRPPQKVKKPGYRWQNCTNLPNSREKHVICIFHKWFENTLQCAVLQDVVWNRSLNHTRLFMQRTTAKICPTSLPAMSTGQNHSLLSVHVTWHFRCGPTVWLVDTDHCYVFQLGFRFSCYGLKRGRRDSSSQSNSI